MTKTRDELIERTLSRLGVIGENRPAYPNEVTMVSVGVEPLLKELTDREIIYVPDAETIDDALFESLATLLADNVKANFGVAALPLDADGSSPVDWAEAKLREIGYGRYSGAIQQGEYM